MTESQFGGFFEGQNWLFDPPSSSPIWNPNPNPLICRKKKKKTFSYKFNYFKMSITSFLQIQLSYNLYIWNLLEIFYKMRSIMDENYVKPFFFNFFRCKSIAKICILASDLMNLKSFIVFIHRCITHPWQSRKFEINILCFGYLGNRDQPMEILQLEKNTHSIFSYCVE